MTLHTLTGSDEPVEPSGIQPGQSTQSCAIQAVGTLLSESPLAHEQFREARHDKAEADRLEAEAAQAGQRSAAAEARAAAERRKANPHERINRRLGTVVAAALALLDALPAYWSAQAFGLDQTSTVILTVLLCAALGGAMWLLDLFSRQGRRSALRILEGILGAGFVTMFALRLQYLQVTGGKGSGPRRLKPWPSPPSRRRWWPWGTWCCPIGRPRLSQAPSAWPGRRRTPGLRTTPPPRAPRPPGPGPRSRTPSSPGPCPASPPTSATRSSSRRSARPLTPCSPVSNPRLPRSTRAGQPFLPTQGSTRQPKENT